MSGRGGVYTCKVRSRVLASLFRRARLENCSPCIDYFFFFFETGRWMEGVPDSSLCVKNHSPTKCVDMIFETRLCSVLASGCLAQHAR